MVGQGAHGRDAGRLLTSARRGRGDEETRVLSPQATLHPLLARVVDEGLPLSRKVAVASRDAEEECIVLLEYLGCDVGDGLGLWWGVHGLEDLLRQSLGDSGTGNVLLVTGNGYTVTGGLTGTDQPYHRRLRRRLSRRRPIGGCGRTWSTVENA